MTAKTNVETPKKAGKRGRPALISDKAFAEVHSKASSLEDIIQTFALLRNLEPKKAKLYVSMRSSAMRKKKNADGSPTFVLKTFKRGRKKGSKNAKPSAEAVAIVANVVETALATIPEQIEDSMVPVLDVLPVDPREEAKALMKASIRSAPLPDPNAEFVDTEEARANDGMCDWDDEEAATI